MIKSISKLQSPESVCQLKAFIDAHGAEVIIRGRAYSFGNFRIENNLRRFADAHTKRAKYSAKQAAGQVIGRPGAETWVILRNSGGGTRLAKFAIHEGKLLELA